MDEQEGIAVQLTRAEALAAGAVLRGYLSHQRERLGAQAAANPNFRNVEGALRAFESALESRANRTGRDATG